MDAVKALKQIFLFRDVSEPVLKLVAEAAEEVTYGAGETIADEHETAPGLLLIRSGTVRASTLGKPPVTFGTGEAIGQMALLTGGPLGMSVVAAERTEALLLRPDRLVQKLAGNHEAGFQLFRAVARSLAARLRRVVDETMLGKEPSSRG